MRLSYMLLRKFHQKTAKGISETLAMSDDSTEVIILNFFVTYIGVSWSFLCGILQRGITELSFVIVTGFLNNCQII